jgi:type IV secretion system protein VirB9
MTIRPLIFSLTIIAPLPAVAQDWTAKVQALPADGGAKDQGRGPPPQLNPLSGPQVPLSRKERRGVAYGRQWTDNADMPARGEDGGVVFVFGATLPTVVCAPLYVCDLVLQAGEAVNDLNVGDSVRWQITPATQGTGDATITHVMIKPTDIGLTTNLVITTNHRAYTIKLVSRAEDWMPRVAFAYPDDVRAAWRSYGEARGAREEAAAAAVKPDGAANFHFGYGISGDNPSWRPVRVFASGAKTYIEFPREIGAGELPTLVALGDDGGLFSAPSKQLVNYRFVHGRFEVDKVLMRAALISGVGGDQTEVRITRQDGSW